MAGLVPAIHVFGCGKKEDVDARDEPGHDGGGRWANGTAVTGASARQSPYSLPPSIWRPISAIAF